jgi:hypothetical protein
VVCNKSLTTYKAHRYCYFSKSILLLCNQKSRNRSDIIYTVLPESNMRRLRQNSLVEPRRSTRLALFNTPETSKESFRFLDLPAGMQSITTSYTRLTPGIEIRNNVYEYCLGLPKLKLKHKGGVCTDRDRSRSSLTQVCKHIRKEYRPLYLRATSIRLSQAEKFVEHFFLPQDANTIMTLKVNLKRPREADPVDILLFLTSTIRRENLKVQFHCEGRGEMLAKSLNRVLRRQKDKWKALLLMPNVSRIDLQPFEDSLTMVITETGFKAWTTQRCVANKDFWADLGFKKHLKLELIRSRAGAARKEWY